MRHLKLFFLLPFLLLAACAAVRSASAPPEEYVEIANPAYTISPNAPATIWVPRRYVESGIPRGGEVLKRGYEKVVQGVKGTPEADLVDVD